MRIATCAFTNNISSEQKIDRIEASLGSIERLLQRRADNNEPPQDEKKETVMSPNASVTISDSSTTNTPAHIDQNEPEQDQGLNVQTDITVALLKQAVRSTTLYGVDSKMGAALGSLYDLLGKRHLNSPAKSETSPFPMQRPVPPGGVGKLEMPPLQATVAAMDRLSRAFQIFCVKFTSILLTRNADGPSTLVALLSASFGMEDIQAVCEQAYGHLDNISRVEFVLVNCLLYYIFEESSILGISPELLVEYQQWAQMCLANVDTGLANLPLLLSSTPETIQCLLLGVSVADIGTGYSKANVIRLTSLSTNLAQL